jgi:hypothetical protein
MSSWKGALAQGQPVRAPVRRRIDLNGLVAAAWAVTITLTAACGGTQGAEPVDAGVDATASALGPEDPDPCGASQTFAETHDILPIATFDSASNNGLASASGTIYVSSDATGILWGCFSAGASCDVSTESQIYSAQVGPIACSNCLGNADGGGCEGCECATGNGNAGQEVLPSSETRCGDSYALHLRADTADGGGLSMWGMNVGIDLRHNPNCPDQTNPDAGSAANPCVFDASGWTGIAFWALLGPGSSATTALVTVGDPQTSSQLGGNEAPELSYPNNLLKCGNPPCADNHPASTACVSTDVPPCLCDPFGKAVGMVNHWEFYTIPFADMRQKGYGRPETTFDLAHILNFTFNLGLGDWDVWIDDISFYKDKSP